MIPCTKQLKNLCAPTSNFLRSLAEHIDRFADNTQQAIAIEFKDVETIVSIVTDEHVRDQVCEGSGDNDAEFENDVELLAFGKIISVLERQLADVNQDIETSVLGISVGFQGMAQRAQSAVKAAGGVGTDDQATSDGTISEIHEVVNGLVQHMGESCDSIQFISNRLSEVERRLTGVDTILSDIEKIASQSKLVALNGQIEAGRLGKAGAVFNVVASETKQLSQHAAETSNRVQAVISELSHDIVTTTVQLRDRSHSDASRLGKSKSDAEKLLGYIENQHQQMFASLSSTRQISQELQGDISRAVMSLQFQDRVRQRLEHVINSLKVLATRADTCTNPHLNSIAEERSKSILANFADSFTMDSERVALAGAAASSTENRFDVELF